MEDEDADSVPSVVERPTSPDWMTEPCAETIVTFDTASVDSSTEEVTVPDVVTTDVSPIDPLDFDSMVALDEVLTEPSVVARAVVSVDGVAALDVEIVAASIDAPFSDVVSDLA